MVRYATGVCRARGYLERFETSKPVLGFMRTPKSSESHPVVHVSQYFTTFVCVMLSSTR